jgi:hypothetical protein
LGLTAAIIIRNCAGALGVRQLQRDALTGRHFRGQRRGGGP